MGIRPIYKGVVMLFLKILLNVSLPSLQMVFAKLNLFRVFIISILMIVYVAPAIAQTGDPVIEWEKRQNIEERLMAFGNDLMGDGIDPSTGSLVFNHVDVDIPGNFNLPVRVERKRGMGETYIAGVGSQPGVNVDFGDWELVVPKISALTTQDGAWLNAGDRCSAW